MVKNYEKIIDYLIRLPISNAKKFVILALIRYYDGNSIGNKEINKLGSFSFGWKANLKETFNAILTELINEGLIIPSSCKDQNDPNQTNLSDKNVRQNCLTKKSDKNVLSLNRPGSKTNQVKIDPIEIQETSMIYRKIGSKLTTDKNVRQICQTKMSHPKIVRVCNNNLDIFNKINLYQDKILINNNNLVDYNNVILVIKSLFRNLNNINNNRDTAKLSKVQIDPPNKKKRRKSEPGRPTYTEDFARFWENYPRKEAKKLAIKAFEKAKLTTDVNKIIEGAKKYAEFVKTHGIESRYILLAHNWLKQERWNDEYETKTSILENLGKGKFYNKGW